MFLLMKSENAAQFVKSHSYSRDRSHFSVHDEALDGSLFVEGATVQSVSEAQILQHQILPSARVRLSWHLPSLLTLR